MVIFHGYVSSPEGIIQAQIDVADCRFGLCIDVKD